MSRRSEMLGAMQMRLTSLPTWPLSFLMIAAAALSCAVGGRTGHAEPSSELVARMESLRQSIGEEQVAADDAQRRKREVDQELTQIKADVERQRKEEKGVAANLKLLEQSQSVSQSDRAKLIEEQTLVKQRLFERIRAVYLVPKASVIAYVVSDQEATSFGLMNNYLEAIYAHDAALVEELKGLTAKIEARSSSLTAMLTEQKTLANELRRRREAVAQKLIAQERVAALARAEKSKRNEAVARLRAKLLRFEATLTGLTGGVYEVAEGEERSRQQIEESFDGAGLDKRLRAPLPVSGRVVTRFRGTRTDGQPSKGLEISAVGPSAVRAIADGRVVFVGELPGLGPVVVLDHGQRSFTLYGRLASLTAQSGSLVAAQESVGELEATKPLYFEVRQAGVAIDPRGIVALP